MSDVVGKNLRGPRIFWGLCMDGPLRTAWADEATLIRIDVSGEYCGR